MATAPPRTKAYLLKSRSSSSWVDVELELDDTNLRCVAGEYSSWVDQELGLTDYVTEDRRGFDQRQLGGEDVEDVAAALREVQRPLSVLAHRVAITTHRLAQCHPALHPGMEEMDWVGDGFGRREGLHHVVPDRDRYVDVATHRVDHDVGEVAGDPGVGIARPVVLFAKARGDDLGFVEATMRAQHELFFGRDHHRAGRLLISAEDIVAPGDTFTAQAPTVNPGGKPGVATVFSSRGHPRGR